MQLNRTPYHYLYSGPRWRVLRWSRPIANPSSFSIRKIGCTFKMHYTRVFRVYIDFGSRSDVDAGRQDEFL